MNFQRLSDFVESYPDLLWLDQSQIPLPNTTSQYRSVPIYEAESPTLNRVNVQEISSQSQKFFDRNSKNKSFISQGNCEN